ncbi:DUF4222 domain-containing protein [Citrobacter freundii]
MRELNRRFKDHRGVPVRVIRREPETQRVIYLRDGYPHECFSPPEHFRQKFREITDDHEPDISNRSIVVGTKELHHHSSPVPRLFLR